MRYAVKKRVSLIDFGTVKDLVRMIWGLSS